MRKIGQLRPVADPPGPPFERPLGSKTCRKVYASNSAWAAVGGTWRGRPV